MLPSKDNSLELSFDNLKARVIKGITKPVRTEPDMVRYLRSWFCRHYNRPYKDPLLEQYTLEELLSEYLDVYYRNNPKALEAETEEGKKSAKADDKWLEKMMEQAQSEEEPVDDRAAKRKRFLERLKTESIDFDVPVGETEEEAEAKATELERHLIFGKEE
jgi:hypothetical protein